MPTAHLLFGPPGCGKSTLAATLGCRVVSRDEVRNQMRRDNPDTTEDAIWAEVIRQMLKELATGRDAALDSVLSNPRRRNEAIQRCGPLASVWLYKPTATADDCLERNRRRSGDARLPDTEVLRQYNLCEQVVFIEGQAGIDRLVSF